jgi:hypothetical protein
MTTQTFSVIGIADLNGNNKVRFTNDMVRRVKIFGKNGATRCEFISLPEPMTKLDGLNYMAKDPMFASAEDQATIADTIADKEKQSGKGYKVNLSLDAILERGKAQQVADNAVLESVLDAVVS